MNIKLNIAQKSAAQHHDGTMLAIAGPGTGKTQTLAARIHIMLVSAAGISPNEILCLTFTDAGAVAMRQKLLKVIGQAAYSINIHTFHSFCNEVIQTNLDYFGVREIDPVSDIEQLTIIHKIIDNLKVDHPLKRLKGDIYYEAGRLKNLFNTMKEESWTPKYIEKKVKQYLESLPTRSEFIYQRAVKKQGVEKGDIKVKAIEEQKEKMDLLIAGAKLFSTYNSMLKKMKRYDFSDMIHWVIRAFNDNKYFLLNFQERYQYILTDEYQDTNGSQSELINMLANYWDDPNLFVVCDEDQTLFSFQGARIQNIIDFATKYKPGVIVFTENYRSNQAILDAGYNLIENNSIRLSSQLPNLDKKLHAVSQEIDPDGCVRVFEFNSIMEEEFWICQEISNLILKGEDPQSIGVIYRKHRQSEEIIKELRLRDIPVHIKRRYNVLESIAVQQLLTTLNYIVAPSQALLYRVLSFGFWNVKKSDLEKYIAEHKEIGGKLKAVVALNELKNKYPDVPLIHTLQEITTKMAMFINRLENKIQCLLELNTFFDFVKAEIRKNPFLTGRELLVMLDKMISNNLSIPIFDVNFQQKGVHFMTAHGSKGLEFKHVYIIGSTRDQWEKSRGGNYEYSYPDTLVLSSSDDKIESERRLFYVSITRAKDFLTITYASRNNEGKDLEHSQFIEESKLSIQPQPNIRNIENHLSKRLFKPVFTPNLEDMILDELLEDYVLSVTHWNQYLRCKVGFYYKYVLRVPSMDDMNEALIYGTAIHRTIKKLYDELRQRPVDQKLTEEWFTMFLDKQRGYLSEDAYQRRLKLGLDTINAYYEKTIPTTNRITLNEYRIKNVVVDDEVPMKCDIDKLAFDGELTDIIDYKTGSKQYTLEALKPPSEKNPYGGDYWRQMIVYKILFQYLVYKPWTFRSAYVELLTSKTQYMLPVNFTHEDEVFIRKQMKEVYNGIKGKVFSPGCGECEWCRLQNDLTNN